MLTQGGDGPVVERAEAFNRAMNELEEWYTPDELEGPPCDLPIMESVTYICDWEDAEDAALFGEEYS